MSVLALLDPYQKDAVDFAVKKKSCGLFFEQGTGKTYIAGGILEHYLNKHSQMHTLIVGILANKETTWLEFLRKFFPHIPIATDWEEWVKLSKTEPQTILLMHYEAYKLIAAKAERQWWGLIIADECHRAKARGSGISRSLKKLRHSSRRKIALSGTPIDKSPEDLWAQFRFFAPEVFGERWADFEEKYMRGGGYMGYKKIFKKKKMPQFLKQIEGHALRVTVEVLGLEEPEVIMRRVGMTSRQKKVYRQLERHSYAELDDFSVRADLAVTVIGKLQQVSGGHVIDDDGVTQYLGSRKPAECVDIFEENDRHPLIIFCKYREDIEILKRHLKKIKGVRVGVLSGGVKKKNRPRIIRRFQKGLYDYFICQIRTGGVGNDFQNTHLVAIYSTTHSLIDFTQAIARVIRRGQTKRVKIFVLTTINTIDEPIYDRILSKRDVTNKVLSRFILTRRKTNV